MQNNKPDLLTVHEVAAQVRVDDTTVRRWIPGGALDAIPLPHLGKRQVYRVRRSALGTLLAPPEQPTEHAYEREPLICQRPSSDTLRVFTTER
jgi:excisionase family DNA binding protein